MTQTAQRRIDEAQRGVLVASVPANHVYVHHLAAEDADGVQRMPDPDPMAIFEHVYAEIPEELAQQRDAFAAYHATFEGAR